MSLFQFMWEKRNITVLIGCVGSEMYITQILMFKGVRKVLNFGILTFLFCCGDERLS